MRFLLHCLTACMLLNNVFVHAGIYTRFARILKFSSYGRIMQWDASAQVYRIHAWRLINVKLLNYYTSECKIHFEISQNLIMMAITLCKKLPNILQSTVEIESILSFVCDCAF